MIFKYMNRKKIVFILPIIFLTVFLSGCIQINISTGVDADFNAFLIYRIEMDVSEVDSRYQVILKNTLNRIGWHYQEELGFAVELGIETDDCLLVMTKRIANNNFEQAYRSLENILTNEELTPFMLVDMGIESGERQSRYIFSAAADIPQIMKLSNIEELPSTLLPLFNEALKTGSGTISVTFPVSELVDSSHQVSYFYNMATMNVPLDYTGRTDFELSAILNINNDGTIGGTLDDIIQEQTKLRNTIFLAAGAFIVILLIVLLAGVLRRKRS